MGVIEELRQRLYSVLVDGVVLENYGILLECHELSALLAVVDAAKEFQLLTHWGMSDSEAELSDKLNKALAELEK